MRLPDYSKYKLISVDIFDTLLFRAVAKPVDVFEKIWETIEERELAKTSMSSLEYMKFRAEMERRARIGAPNREIIIDQIYEQYPDYICDDVNALMQVELEVEKEYCYCNSFVYNWLLDAHRDGVQLCLLSDMYLTKAFIIELLQNNGIDTSIFSEVIVSNEYFCNKQNGELYDVLFEKFSDITKDEILHIGDNYSGDYVQAKNKGVHAFRYNAIPDQLNSVFDYEKIRHNIPLSQLLSLRKAAMYHNPYEDEMEKVAYELGSCVTGPVLSLYIAWVVKRLRKLDIHRIYPFMREGYLLGKLLEEEAKNQDYDLEVHPIYVSRKVTYIPSIKKVNREEIENMIGARNLTIRESIVLMGLDEDSFGDITEYLDCKHKETHLIPYKESTLKEYLIQLFLEPENVARIENYIQLERKKLVAYLKQEIGDLQNIATIDIGFFGRIQMWMEECLNLEGVPHQMKHFLAVGVTGDRIYDGYDFEGYFSTFAGNADLIPTIHRTTDVIEKLISVTEGSTIGYQEIDGRIKPLQAEGVDNERLTQIAFEGALQFQKLWFSFRTNKPRFAKEAIDNRREVLQVLHRMIDMPRKCEAMMLGGLEADTNFGTNYKKGIITEEHLVLAKEKGVDFVDKCNVSYTYQNSNITWPKGVVTLLDEFYYVRRALKNGSQNEIIKSLQEVVEQVQEDGIKEVALYGAGENGRQFYFLCQMYNIKATCFIDRKESIWGTFKEGVEVMGIDEAMRRGNKTFIVTSLFSISEISDFIKEKFDAAGEVAEIYSV